MFRGVIRLCRSWAGKVGFGVFDQAIFSGSNFILNMLLIRWILPSEYGIFAITFSVFLFFSSFYKAFIFEPMSVIGVVYYRSKFPAYVGSIVWIQAALAVLSSGVISLIAVVMAVKGNPVSNSFFGLAFSTPLILFFWLFRQLCYIEEKPALALKGSILYAFLLLSALVFIYKQRWLSPSNILCLMGFSSIVSSLMFWRYLGFKKANFYWRNVKDALEDVIMRNWRYGKWSMGGALVVWSSTLVYLPLVGIFVGFSQAGIFRAMQNLFLPLQRFFAPLMLLFVPRLSKRRATKGDDYLKRSLSKFTVVNILLSIGYVVAVISFGPAIIKLLYGQDLYVQYAWVLPYLGMVLIIEAFTQGLYIGLQALERPDAIFWSHTAGAVLALTLGLHLVKSLKLYGAALGSLFTVALVAIVLGYFAWSHFKRSGKK